VGRSPKRGRPESAKIGDHLYKKHKEQQEKQEKLKLDQQQRLAAMRKQGCQSTKASQKMVQNNKKCRLNEIFDILDSDQDNYISA